MILSTLSFGVHMLVSSFRLLRPVGQVLEYVLPQYRNMSTKAVKGKINFNTKHLKKGDPLPPYNGKLRVYNMRYCPYAQRTILALNAKKIDYEVVNINLNEKPEWLTQKSAFAKVPALEVAENVSIYESLITAEYLDDVYPERPLLSKDPVKRAFDKIIVEACSPIHALIFKAVRFPDSVTEENIEAYEKALLFAQNQLKARDTQFFGGNEPGYTDYMTWPWFERILILRKKYNVLKFDTEKYKLLAGYFNRMLQDPAVSQYAVPEDILFKYIDLYKQGQPDYDMLLE